MRNGLLLVALLVLAVACIDKKDYTLTSVVVQPAVAVPLAFGDLSILDVLSQSDTAYVKIDATDQVFLDYRQTLFTTQIRGLFTIPNKTVSVDIPLPPVTVPPHANDIRFDSVTEVIDLGLSPEQLTSIDFKAGSIVYDAQLVPGNANLPIEVLLISTDLKQKSTGANLWISWPPNGTVDLSEYKATLNNNKFNLKMVIVLKSKPTSSTIPVNTSMHVDFKMQAMDFNLITGFMGDQSVSVPQSTLQIGAFGSSLSGAAVSFKAINVSMDVQDDYGVPCKLDFVKFQSENDKGGTVTAQLTPPSPVSINFPSTPGTSALTAITATNAIQMLNIGPTRVVYQFNARINPGLSSGNNFVGDTSKLSATLHVTIPLAGHASNLVLADTTALDLGKIDQSEVSTASLKVKVNNELPMGGTMQFYFIDDKNHIIDSLLLPSQTAILPPSLVSTAGDLETAGVYDASIPLDPAQVNAIFTSKGIITKVKLSTSKDATGSTVDVNFRSKYRIQVNLGLLANLKFDLEK